jgi:hypothetical protein
MFNFADFLKVALPTAVGVLPFVMALVTYWGKLGVQGKAQLVSSMATGLVLGGGVMYLQTLPHDLTSWASVVIFGLIEGLAASGVYEVGVKATAKALKS